LALTQFSKEVELLVNLSSKLQFDGVHAHWTYEFAIAALKIDTNAIMTAHDAPLTIFRWFKDPYRFLRLVMAVRVRFLAKNLTCVSPYLSKKWQSEMFWRREISVIPNICPFPAIEGSPPFSNSARMITVGDSTKRKNVKNLILAMHEIRKVIPSATLDIFGYGLDAESNLALWAKENSIDSGLNWHGFASRNEIQDALDQSDLMIHPSLEESQPMVPLEAMSRGIPIIGGLNAGGVPWTIVPAGVLVDVKTPREIALRAIEILQSPELRHSMSKKGIELVREKYSPQNVAHLYLNLYDEVALS
jgi:glycosyltransferase involved in cell wall biosynthesis